MRQRNATLIPLNFLHSELSAVAMAAEDQEQKPKRENTEYEPNYTLNRECLNNAEDADGHWQIEGGTVFERRRHVASYSSVKRVSCGTQEQNTTMLWITLFFIGKKPPENMTLHGAHDFDSGGEIGSVSAASPGFSGHIGKQFKRVVNTLTIA